MTWLPYTYEQRSEFAALASLYAAARTAFREVAASSRWAATPGSTAAADHDALATRELMPGMDLLITGLCHDYMYAACEQFGAMWALYQANEVLLVPNVIARCAVEHVAHVAWVLGPSTDGVDQRHARALLEELAGAEHAKTTAGHLIGKSSSDYGERYAHWKELKAVAKRAYPDLTSDPATGKTVICGYTLPRPEKIVTAVYGYLTPPLPEKQREGIYDFLSNHVHPTLYVTRELFRSRQTGDGERTAELAVDPEYHQKLARLTVAPFHLVLAMILSYHNWPDTHLKRLEAEIDAALPGMLAGTRKI